MSLGMTHREAAFALYAVCLLLNIVALVLVFSNSIAAAALLAVLTIVGFFAMRQLGYIQFSSTHFLWTSGDDRAAQDDRARWFGTASRGDDRSRSLGRSQGVGAGCGRCRRHAEPADRSRQRDLDDAAIRSGRCAQPHEHPAFASSLHVPTSRSAETLIEFTWRDGRSAMDRDEEIALESFAEHSRRGVRPRCSGRAQELRCGCGISLMNSGYVSGMLARRKRTTGDLVAEDGKTGPVVGDGEGAAE